MLESYELSLKFCSYLRKNVVTVNLNGKNAFCLSGRALNCSEEGCKNKLCKYSLSLDGYEVKK